MFPPTVKRFNELFAQVWLAPNTRFGFNVTAPAPDAIVNPPAPAKVNVCPPLFSKVIARASGALAPLIVKLPISIFAPKVIELGLPSVVAAEKKTLVPAPGTNDVAVPALVEPQLLAVLPLEADHTLGLPANPPTQKAFVNGRTDAIVAVSVVAVAPTALTVKFVALYTFPKL